MLGQEINYTVHDRRRQQTKKCSKRVVLASATNGFEEQLVANTKERSFVVAVESGKYARQPWRSWTKRNVVAARTEIAKILIRPAAE
jgi:hypothetical protein